MNEQLIEKAGIAAVEISENINPKLTAQEQALFIAGFQECIKWLKTITPDEQDFLWQSIVVNIINDWKNEYRPVTYQDIANELKQHYTIIKNKP